MAAKVKVFGTCAACGRKIAVLKGGKGAIAHHGHTAHEHYHAGACKGAGYLPLENGVQVAEKVLADVVAQLEEVQNTITALENTEETVYITHGNARFQVEVKAQLIEEKGKFYAVYVWAEENQKTELKNYGTKADTAKYYNEKYKLPEYRAKAENLEAYVKGIKKQIANFEPKELTFE